MAGKNSYLLASPVNAVPGVGPQRSELLNRLEIRTVEDLLLHRPRRYEDRRHFRPIRSLEQGESALTCGKVVAVGVKWFARRTKSICELILDDGTARLHCRWWNLEYMERYFAVGDHVVVFGKVLSVKPRVMDHPDTEVVPPGEEEELIHLNRIVPIYPLTEGLPQRWLRAQIWRTLEVMEAEVPEPWGISIAGLRVRDSGVPLPTRAQALRMLHFPRELDETTVARQRLALDEFVELQRQIRTRRRNFETKAEALPCAGDNRYIRPFLAHLGYKLTEAQTRVLREMRADLGGKYPMRRLLQGDVGSGKTVVAACCALMTLESGYDVALMAPTEILAEQHARTFSKWFEPLGIPVEVHTGSRKTADQKAAPGPGLYVGTHALIEKGFSPEKLGLVIIDEQHRFGVEQREQFLRKGHYPHLLVMTATPIPRTLSLSLYGELDSSVIDQLPPGRGVIKTFIRTTESLPKVWAFVRQKLEEGRQAYVVYPRIEETEAGVKAVLKEQGTLEKALAPHQVALLHGRMPARDKEAAVTRFRQGEVQVLLSTSLIEVGVDVANASIMVIENAEMFGLAQLHQLRGRIGRGAHDSYCILVQGKARRGKGSAGRGQQHGPDAGNAERRLAGTASPTSASPTQDQGTEANERLKVLEETTDGFKIAEADLRLRGPGEFLGQAQSGAPRLRFGDFATDFDLIIAARDLAEASLAAEGTKKMEDG